MRLMFLTNVAVAALAALCFHVGAQDSDPKLDQKKQSPAAESNQAATSQKNPTPERAGRSAAEPMNSSVARPEMKSRGAAKQEMKSATGPAEKAMPGDAAKKRNAERPMQSSAGKQPATAQGETAKQGRHATGTMKRKGTGAETNTAPPSMMRSVAPSSNEPRRATGRATVGGHHVTSPQGEVQTPSKSTSRDMTAGRSATAGLGKAQSSAKAVKLNERQQAEVRGVLRSEQIEKLDRVDFSLSTGTIVPSYAPIRPLPERIVEIVPQYRGYDFVMMRDEIVIIEPRTRRIVTVLQGEGRSAVSAPPRGLRLTSEQRQVIRRDLAPEGSAIHTQVQLGERVPEDISLLPMPTAVLSDVPIVGGYLYFVTDEGVVLVAPDTSEVVELIP
jgi:hypothetical protein